MELTVLIEALSQPSAYCHPVEKVEVRQTHISVVFLAGPYAYKIKKPVNMGFLDFTSLEKRRHFCGEEIRLNRRLAPAVYLGVVPVTMRDGEVRMQGDGETIEWAVQMERLPDTATLRERLLRGDVSAQEAEALARTIASFHDKAQANETIAAFGRFESVARNLRDIFKQSAPQVGTTVSPVVFARLQELTEAMLARLRPVIEERACRGMTRDTHGDLHLDHVYFFPEKQPPADLVIIDCIEFNERFRFTDPVADMAFPVMDFAFYGRTDLARAFADAYFRATSDREGRSLLPLYTAYRAMVRGSVEGLKLVEKEITLADRTSTLEKARAHWLLALGELEQPGNKSCLVLVGGLPGTGKSSLAQALAGQANFTVVRSDVIRKGLAGFAANERTAPTWQEKLYTPEWNDRTYGACLEKAEGLLWEGKRVIVDATFREDKKRLMFLEAAIKNGVPAVMLLCRADPETVRRRLAARREDASDAGWPTYLQLAKQWEEPGPVTQRVLHEIPSAGSLEGSTSTALQHLREVDLWE
jgi:aminoglycoside phosphotransferase family enzyme/predicted kinase